MITDKLLLTVLPLLLGLLFLGHHFQWGPLAAGLGTVALIAVTTLLAVVEYRLAPTGKELEEN